MKKKRILVLMLIVAALAVAALLATRPVPETGLIRLSGNIEISDVQASFEISGRVIERTVSEGESVTSGQLLARLDDRELRHQVELYRADLGAARSWLAELEAGTRPEEVAQVRATLTRARAEAARAKREYQRQEALLARDVISSREFEVAEAAHRMALAQVDEFENRLALAERGPRPEQIQQGRERANRAAEALALAETRLSYATLIAPTNGLVLADHVEPGEQVGAGTPIVTIGDVTTTWLRGYIDETDLGRVAVGQRVRVTTDTYPDEIYEGTLSFIASEAEFTPKLVQTTKERVKLVYRVKIDIPNPSGELKPGMPADADIDLSRAEGAAP